ncbi:MAG: ferredoxin-like protein [Chloroflexota bacterium]
MHHSLRFYSRNREWFLKFYMFGARFTRLPLAGHLARWVANTYGQRVSQAYLLSPAEAEEIVDISEGLAVGPCSCRQVFHNCDNPVSAEIMVGLTRNIFREARPHDYREITREEAREILRDCHRRGLIQTIIRCQHDFYAICNCCSCCCVPLRLNKQYGIGEAAVRNAGIVQEFRQHQLEHRH